MNDSDYYQIQKTEIINHPEYSQPVLLVHHGWARRDHETEWTETEIKEITW